jgi:hypothetical protein
MLLTGIVLTMLAPIVVGFILRRDRDEYNIWWENILFLVFSPGIALVAILEAYFGDIDVDTSLGASFVFVTLLITSLIYWVAFALLLHAFGQYLTRTSTLAF